MTKDEALQMCLEYIETDAHERRYVRWAINEALAQPAQEPVAYLCKPDQHGLFDPPTPDKACKDCFPVYTVPPQRPWVNVRDEEIKILWIQYRAALPRYLCFARALLARAKEKNT